MDENKFKEYQTNRYEDQVVWYSKKSASNKTLYQWLQWGAIILSATMPVLVVSIEDSYNFITAGLSIVLAVVTAGLKTFKFQENWVNYRTIAETLKKEKYYYDAELNEYSATEDKEKLFVERVETLTSRENTFWVAIHKKKEQKQEDKRLTKSSSGRAKGARR